MAGKSITLFSSSSHFVAIFVVAFLCISLVQCRYGESYRRLSPAVMEQLFGEDANNEGGNGDGNYDTILDPSEISKLHNTMKQISGEDDSPIHQFVNKFWIAEAKRDA